MQAVNVGPVSPDEQTQSPVDLFLIFAGANIVATTLQAGASLTPAFGLAAALTLIVIGGLAGSALVATLAPIGSRLGVPSVVAARAALGYRGAALVAIFLYLTNFAWIAVNNVIAASVCTRFAGGDAAAPAWAAGLGLAATAVVARGPRLVSRADRVAVPLLLMIGAALTIACVRLPAPVLFQPATGTTSWLAGLDIVIAYQVSWILMFADYSRYTRSPAYSAVAVFSGLALTSLWFMPLGFMAAAAAASNHPALMLEAVGLGGAGAVLLAVATVTTNFVNIYISALAVRSLLPRAPDQLTVWATGGVGAALSLLSGRWLDSYASFMYLLGAALVPVAGVLFGHFVLAARQVAVADLYRANGPSGRRHGFAPDGLAAWAAGATIYFLGGPLGGTLPALAVSSGAYLLLGRACRRGEPRL